MEDHQVTKERPKILLVEDEEDIREIMSLQLQQLGPHYQIHTAENGLSAKDLLIASATAAATPCPYHLIILDWMLPGLSGLDLCQIIRHKWGSSIPVLMVTAKAEDQNIIDGLNAGADDYICKPFAAEVFMARVKALLRRMHKIPEEPTIAPAQKEDIKVMTCGPISINEEKFEVRCSGQKIQLTLSELKILKGLIKRPGHVFTRKQLIEEMGGPGIHVTVRTIDTQLVGLRKKLGEHANLIETIRGIGYKFMEPIP